MYKISTVSKSSTYSIGLYKNNFAYLRVLKYKQFAQINPEQGIFQVKLKSDSWFTGPFIFLLSF